jgi:hypothetical protein
MTFYAEQDKVELDVQENVTSSFWRLQQTFKIEMYCRGIFI